MRELAGMMFFLKITINGESAKKQSCRHNPQKKIFIGSHFFSSMLRGNILMFSLRTRAVNFNPHERGEHALRVTVPFRPGDVSPGYKSEDENSTRKNQRR